MADPISREPAWLPRRRFDQEYAKTPLNPAEAVVLARLRNAGDQEAANLLAVSVYKLGKQLVWKTNPNGDGPDLEARAALAAFEAANRWDPSKGVKFATYAYAWIEKSLKNERAILHPKVSARAVELDACVTPAGGNSFHETVPAKIEDYGDADVLAAKRRELQDAEQAVARHSEDCKRARICRCPCARPVDGSRAVYAGTTEREREVCRNRFNRQVASCLEPLRDELARREAGVSSDEFEYELRSNRDNSNDVPSPSSVTKAHDGWGACPIHSKARGSAVGAQGRRERTAESIGSWLFEREKSR
jgi:hypothetical protein